MHVAQINVARALFPIDDEGMLGFTSRLDEINALAENSPGFVWRMKSDSGKTIQLASDPMLVINYSIWTDVDSLRAFTFDTLHRELLRDRKKWFQLFDKPSYVLWYVDDGETPSLTRAWQMLRRIQNGGPDNEVFDFKSIPSPAG